MSTPAVTPKESTTEELRAQAIAAQSAPPGPPIPPGPFESLVSSPPPDPNEPFTLTEGEGGQVEVKLRTGEVFKGSALEVARHLAKSKVDTTDYSKDLKSQLKELQDRTQHISDALTPKPPAPTEEEQQQIQLQKFLADQQAVYLGYSDGETMKRELANIRQTSEQSRNDRIAMDFMAECPEFPASPENSDKLLQALVDHGVITQRSDGSYTEPTAKQLTMAHAYCVQAGLYRPLTEEELQQQINAGMRVKPKMQVRPTAPPMVPGSQPETVQNKDSDPWAMPMDQLRLRAQGR